jgi:hypothetical protein
MPSKFWFLFLLVAALIVAGCGKIVAPEAPQSFGLTKVEFKITPEYLGALNSNVFIRLEVPARAEINGSDRKVLVRYSGQTSIGQLKKSYTFELVNDEFRGHREYVLSAQNGDLTKFNSTIGFFAFRQAGLQTPEAEPAAVYVNGEYQGLYYLIEPIDADFLRFATNTWARYMKRCWRTPIFRMPEAMMFVWDMRAKASARNFRRFGAAHQQARCFDAGDFAREYRAIVAGGKLPALSCGLGAFSQLGRLFQQFSDAPGLATRQIRIHSMGSRQSFGAEHHAQPHPGRQ